MVKEKNYFISIKITLSLCELHFDFTVKNACVDILSIHFWACLQNCEK